MAPSLVTCPTMITAIPRRFATHQCARDFADLSHTTRRPVSLSRADCLHRVEHHERGPHLLDVAKDGAEVGLSRQVELIGYRVSAAGSQPRRAADSSPVTYRVVCPLRAQRAATSSNSVDFPTPGSPASSTQPLAPGRCRVRGRARRRRCGHESPAWR